jgi:hypothetical protein
MNVLSMDINDISTISYRFQSTKYKPGEKEAVSSEDEAVSCDVPMNLSPGVDHVLFSRWMSNYEFLVSLYFGRGVERFFRR